MAKADVVSKGVQDLQSAQLAANQQFLDSYYDAVVADQPAASPTPGTFTQADIDAAVAKVTAADQGAMQDALDKLSLDDAQVAKLKASLTSLAQEIGNALAS